MQEQQHATVGDALPVTMPRELSYHQHNDLQWCAEAGCGADG